MVPQDLTDQSLFDTIHVRKNVRKKGITFITADKEETFYSYADLFQGAKYLLADLQAAGIRKGEEVILQTDDNQNFLTAFWACILGGIIPVPVAIGRGKAGFDKVYKIWDNLNTPCILTDGSHFHSLLEVIDETSREVAEQMRQRHVLFENMGAATGKAILHRPELDDIAFIQYSSGSTGRPKGVVLTHRNLAYNVSDLVIVMELYPDSRVLSWVPLTHDLGMIAFHLASVGVGLHQYIMPTSLFVRRPKLWMSKVSQHKITATYSPNFGMKYYLNAIANDPEALAGLDLSALRNIINGAEPIASEVCRDFVQGLAAVGISPNCVKPSYGLAEASVGVSTRKALAPLQEYFLDRKALEVGAPVVYMETESALQAVSFIDLGPVFPSTIVQICDAVDQVLPANFLGHVQIKGENVTKGYYNNPEATAQVFTNDGWLRTGDLGFLTPHGTLVITGRTKNVLILQGQNYYAHDIERLLFSIPDLDFGKLAVCGLAGSAQEAEKLLLFVVFRKSTEDFIPLIDQINERLVEVLGVTADAIIPIRRLPKTTSGKVQYFELMQAYQDGDFDEVLSNITSESKRAKSMSSQAIAWSEFELKEWMLGVWQEVLQADNLSPNINFFHCGGDSLKLSQLIYKIYSQFGCYLSRQDIFKAPTVNKLCQLLLSETSLRQYPAILPRKPDALLPASNVQKRFWIGDHLADQGAAFNISACFRISGTFDQVRLIEAFSNLIKRHEILRTTLYEKEDKLWQHIHPIEDCEGKLQYVDLSAVSDPMDSLHQACEAQLQQHFDLSTGPLLEAVLYTLDKDHFFHLVIHHAICDEQAIRLLLEDLIQSYHDLSEQKEDSLQYGDFTLWNLEQLKPQEVARDRAYWAKRFVGKFPVLSIPTDFPRPPLKTYQGAFTTRIVDNTIIGTLERWCLDHETTRFTALLTLVYAFLKRYTSERDIVLGVPVSGRTHPQAEHLLGCFINLLPVRLNMASGSSFSNLAGQVGSILEEDLQHDQLPFEEMLDAMKYVRDVSRHPLVDVIVQLRQQPAFELSPNASGAIYDVPFQQLPTQFDCTFEFLEDDDHLRLRLQYNTDLFAPWRMEAMLDAFMFFFEQAVRHPLRPIEGLDWLPSAKKQALITTTSQQQNPEKDTGHVIDLWYQQLYTQAQKNILLYQEESWTMEQVEQTSNQLAQFLLDTYDSKKGDIIALKLERSPWLVISLLTALKLGRAYLPLDPSGPLVREKLMLEDSQAAFILDEETIVTFQKNQEKYQNVKPVIEIAGSDLCYVMYTSGSSGKPKGVMIEHDNLLSFFGNIQGNFGIKPDYTFAAATSYTFDISVLELLGTIVNGIPIRLLSGEPEELCEDLYQKAFSALQITPSRLKQIRPLLGGSYSPLASLELLMVGGEAMSPQLFDELKTALPDTTLLNVYGPTETTIWSSALTLHQAPTCSIGKPLYEEQIYVLDEQQQLVLDGVTGELFITGAGVGRGYLNRPNLNREKFLPDPFRTGLRMYRTGDYGYRLPDGDIQFLGRIDQQLKIRGHRIELGEIEAALKRLFDLVDVVVHCHQEHASALVAYWVSDREIDALEFRKLLALELPHYMIPQAFVEIEEIPLNTSGKVDRKALAKYYQLDQLAQDYHKPANALEEKLLECWKKTLKVDQLGTLDNFFWIGGDSLTATRLVSDINAKFGIQIKARAIFNYPTIQALGKHLVSLMPSHEETKTEATIFSINSAQWQRLVNPNERFRPFIARYMPTNHLDLEAVQNTVRFLLERFKFLTTRFELSNTNYTQVISTTDEPPLQTIDLRSADETTIANARDTLLNVSLDAVDIVGQDLFGLVVLQLAEEEELYLFAYPHLMGPADWSALLQQFHQCYLKSDHQTLRASSSTAINESLQKVDQHIEDHALLAPFKSRQLYTQERETGRNELHKTTWQLPIKYTSLLSATANEAFNTHPEDILLTTAGLTFGKYLDRNRIALLLDYQQTRIIPNAAIGLGTTDFTIPLIIEAVAQENWRYHIKATKEYLREAMEGAKTFFPALSINRRTLSKLDLSLYCLGEIKNLPPVYQPLHFADGCLLPYLDKRPGVSLVTYFEQGQLNCTLFYSDKYMSKQAGEALLLAYGQDLIELIDRCCHTDKLEATPSDFDCQQLSIGDVEALEALFE